MNALRDSMRRLAAAKYQVRLSYIALAHHEVMRRNCPWYRPKRYQRYVDASFVGAYQAQNVDALMRTFDRMVHRQ